MTNPKLSAEELFEAHHMASMKIEEAMAALKLAAGGYFDAKLQLAKNKKLMSRNQLFEVSLQQYKLLGILRNTFDFAIAALEPTDDDDLTA
jgi:hypothetical protein